MYHSLEGQWNVVWDGDRHAVAHLPGTLDQNQIGNKDIPPASIHPDENAALKPVDVNAPITSRFTRKYSYEGAAVFSRTISVKPVPQKRIFLEVERARCLSLRVNGAEVSAYRPQSISTPHIFELTGLLNGNDLIELTSDNHYPGLPHDSIVYSSAATDETQTNWNGILGYFRLREEDESFIAAVRVYPHKNRTVTLKVDVDSLQPIDTTLRIESDAFATIEQSVSLSGGKSCITLPNVPLKTDCKLWDEEEGNLYTLSAALGSGQLYSTRFGVREWSCANGRFTLNGRTIFVRSEANCAEFPEEGHPPVTVERWKEVLSTYRSYGVNLMRFHSHCPPEAAFTAADELGMLMQPELSHWNPKNAFEDDAAHRYYSTEFEQILYTLANHPSFVMITFGNELQAGELGHARMDALLANGKEWDDTRMYADGSNNHYGQRPCNLHNDFYTSQSLGEKKMRGIFAGSDDDGRLQGYINNQYPSAKTNYNATIDAIRETFPRPVYSFEVGQFEVLPDFDELEDFKGISDPVNLRIIKEKVEKKGLLPRWKEYVEATGELSHLAYREEVEAVLRTPGMSGISLLGIQDFPGQGTALVGMLNSHLNAKPFPFAQPERFRSFFCAQLPLVLLEKYTYQNTEPLKAAVQIANYGKHPLCGAVEYTLCGGDVVLHGKLAEGKFEVGTLSNAGEIVLPLEAFTQPTQIELTVRCADACNHYPIWVYPETQPVCPEQIYETKVLDEAACKHLKQGGTVFLAPDSTKEALPNSIRAQFTTDFWSVGTFVKQQGGMGQLIDASHPIFQNFPTQTHTNWQWWAMANQRAVILPREMECIITEMDSYAFLRPMAKLVEFRCGNGVVLLSTMGLHNLQQYPEARALLHSIYCYLESGACRPTQQLTLEEAQELVI